MKTISLAVTIIILLFFYGNGQAQEAEGHKHSAWDILSGSGSEEIVCYKKTHRTYYFVFLGGIITLASVFYSRYRIKQKANTQLNLLNGRVLKQNAEIEEKNKDITDSIRYAQRIQYAILPDPDLLRHQFPESFIYYKPRDIVSGDFYFLRQSENYFHVAACDCTGHGVPGALMSVLGTNALEKALSETNNPGEALNKADHFIKQAIREGKGAAVSDSMDLAMVSFDRPAGMVTFSGAMNPMIVIRNKGEEALSESFIPGNGKVLYEVKGDKYSCGQKPGEETFNTFSFTARPGDALYLYSDGFADQFGGERGKKFKQRNLKELLLEVSSLPFAHQQEKLQEFFTRWKGSLEQVDDVLLIGIQLA